MNSFDGANVVVTTFGFVVIVDVVGTVCVHKAGVSRRVIVVRDGLPVESLTDSKTVAWLTSIGAILQFLFDHQVIDGGGGSSWVNQI